MHCKFFEKNVQNVLVIGPIYDKIDKLNKIFDFIKKYDLIVINGNICFPNDEKIQDRIAIVEQLLQTNKVIYNVGNFDYQCMLTNNIVKKWIDDKPNVVGVKFVRGTRLIIVSGGLVPNMTWEDLQGNLKISFVSEVDDMPWHLKYNGKLGYVISNNPLKNGPPEFFNYSARIGTKSENPRVYGQEVNENGLQKTFLI
jgi:hypothetical protein